MSVVLGLYRAATVLAAPLRWPWLGVRTLMGREERARIGERFGRGGGARPAGRLIWLHAASVGESGVALAMVEALARRAPQCSFLITTGTRTSAGIVAERAGAHTRHAYIPLDSAGAVRRFIQWWRPDLGVFVESELWPNLILEAEAAGVPLTLVNARMSPSTLRRWLAWRAAGERLMRVFAWVSAADARTAETLSALRGAPCPTLGNLKLAAPAPPVDAAKRAALAHEIGARRLWIAASTHPGEEEIALAAHRALRDAFPDALLILIPRKPDRGPAVAALAEGAPRRTLGAPIASAPVYVADTMGEMGTLYDLAPVALVGGSLLAHLKGHNPIEPAKHGAAILSGPHVESFEEVFAQLNAAGGARCVNHAEEIAAAVAALWTNGAAHEAQTQAARAIAARGDDGFSETIRQLAALMPAGAHVESKADAPA